MATRSSTSRFVTWTALGVIATLLSVPGRSIIAQESKAVYEKLEETIPLQFKDAPLEDVLKFIRSASQGANNEGIPFKFDEAGMKRAGKTPTSRVTIDSTDKPVKTSLRQLLKTQGLSYSVKKGVLTITAE